uniref:Uncharacterized protein n=1 Tax=Cucumis melo TaxID=3656 RepID=A0A9I9E2S7_CUCME
YGSRLGWDSRLGLASHRRLQDSSSTIVEGSSSVAWRTVQLASTRRTANRRDVRRWKRMDSGGVSWVRSGDLEGPTAKPNGSEGN